MIKPQGLDKVLECSSSIRALTADVPTHFTPFCSKYGRFVKTDGSTEPNIHGSALIITKSILRDFSTPRRVQDCFGCFCVVLVLILRRNAMLTKSKSID
jgi:hypothetical protein